MHFDLLAENEEPRHDERLVLLAGVADALSFLEAASRRGGIREILVPYLGSGMEYAVSRMTDREVRSAVALRIAAGELRVVEVRASAPLTHGGRMLRVLRGTERPRAGESALWFVDADSANHFLLRLHADSWSRRGVEEAARGGTWAARGDDVRPVLRRFAERLASGRASIVRVNSPPAASASQAAALTRVPVLRRA
jgi:hypothetical protein